MLFVKTLSTGTLQESFCNRGLRLVGVRGANAWARRCSIGTTTERWSRKSAIFLKSDTDRSAIVPYRPTLLPYYWLKQNDYINLELPGFLVWEVIKWKQRATRS